MSFHDFHRALGSRCLPLLLLVVLACSMAVVTAAPINGELFTYSQPNGETFKVRLWGDEFFAYQETEDGYLVVRDPRKGFFCYAEVLPDGSDIVSTGVRVGHPKPAGLKPKQRLAKGKAFEKSLPMRARYGADERGRPVFPSRNDAAQGKVPAQEASPDADSSNQILESPQYAPAPTGDATTGGETPTIQFAPPANGTVGARVGLVLLASFPDAQSEITKTPAQIETLFNAPTYTTDGNATSVYGYFQIQSGGQLSYTNVVTAWFTAANNKAYYTDPTASGRALALVKEGLAILAGNGFDFTQCDGNGDGRLDGVNVFYAGAAVNAWAEGLWPHAGGFNWDPILAEGMTSTSISYQMTDMPAPLGIGTTCHENGHMICKFPDLYTYDGNAAGTGNFSLMGGGDAFHPPNIDPYLKMHAGWITTTDVTLSGQTDHTLNVDGGNVIRYVNPNNPKEYFLFEMRGETGYEGPYGGAAGKICPSKGLVIYHAKEDGSNSKSSIFTADSPNCDYSKPMELLVVEDNPSTATIPWYDDPSPDSQDAFDTGDVIVDTSTPGLAFWSSRGRTIPAGITVTNIQVNASNLTFSIQNNNPPPITATPNVVQVGSNTTLTVLSNGSLTYAWTKVSGPGAATFGTPTAATTTASFNTIGTYVVRVTTSDGVTQMVSEISVTVTGGVNDCLGSYKSLPVGNNYHIGWIEFAASQLQWRNAAGVKWNLSTTANPDVLLTGATPYGTGLEFRFFRQNGQITKFTFNGGTYYRCNPIGNNLSVSTPKNVAVATPLTASDVDNDPATLTYSVVTPPVNGTLSGTPPNLTYTPNSNFAGSDAFTFSANDGTYASNAATVSINVYAPGNEPKYRLIVFGGDGDGEYRIGETAAITADAAPAGKEFDQWLGDVGALANPNSTSTTLTMPASDVIVTASFKSLEYLKEYVGYYALLAPTNDWHYGWIEIVAGQLRWRNKANATWNLLPSAQADVLLTDQTCPYGAGLKSTFGRASGRITQFVFQNAVYIRFGPVAIDSSVYTFPDVPVAVTLTAYDPQSDPMTYTVVTQPTHGALSGTAPNLTYTPASGYTGADSLEFIANDSQSDSNPATISITVRTNVAPVVGAGSDQDIYLVAGAGSGNPVGGAHFEWDAAKDTAGSNAWPSSTGNAYTWTFDGGSRSPVAVSDARFNRLTYAYVFPAAKDVSNTSWNGYGSAQSATFEFVMDVDADNGLLFESGDATTGIQLDISSGALRGYIKSGGTTYTVSYPLTATDKSRYIHAVFVVTLNSKFELYVDGTLRNSVVFNAADWSGANAAGLGNSSSTAPNSNKVDFSGKLALFRYYKNKALSAAEVVTNLVALSNASATAILDGSVVDTDDTPATIWSVVSTPPTGLSVPFGNASSMVSTATFTQPGAYTLRLTANDGFAQVSDDVIITVHDALPAAYASWANGFFDKTFTDKAIDSNPDSDQRSNLMEFAFGTDPTLMDAGPLATDGSRHGDPVPKAASGGGFELYFVRRVDQGTQGSVSYTACFSSDLATFYDNDNTGNPLVVVGTSSVNSAYQVVKVPFPSSLPNGQAARFGRVRMQVTP